MSNIHFIRIKLSQKGDGIYKSEIQSNDKTDIRSFNSYNDLASFITGEVSNG